LPLNDELLLKVNKREREYMQMRTRTAYGTFNKYMIHLYLSQEFIIKIKIKITEGTNPQFFFFGDYYRISWQTII